MQAELKWKEVKWAQKRPVGLTILGPTVPSGSLLPKAVDELLDELNLHL